MNELVPYAPLVRRQRLWSSRWGRSLIAVVAARPLRGCSRVGRRAEVRGRLFIESFGRIEIGDNFCLNSEPVSSHLVTGHQGRLQIGDHVSIDFGAAIASHGRIEIGNRVRIGPYAMIMDTDFHAVADRDGVPEAGAIRIGDDVRVGSRVTILKGAVIGAGASVASGSVVIGHVPPGARVGGVPARVLAAAGGSPETLPIGTGDSGSLGEAAVAEQMRQVVATTFSLEQLPELSSGPESLLTWDSLGTLTLLLEIEKQFHVSLSEAQMLGARTVQDLVDAVLQAFGGPTPREGGTPGGMPDGGSQTARACSLAGTGDSGSLGKEAVAEQMRQVVATTFSLEQLPELSSGPESILTWDSLGTLTLLLEIEKQFHVSLSEAEMLGARTVQDLVDAVWRARDGALR